MSESMDIRDWARAEGLQVPARGPLPKDVITQWESRERPPEETISERVIPVGDQAPKPRGEGFKAWWKKSGPAQTERRPVRRVSVENLVSTAWGISAFALGNNPALVPVARMLDLQAPVAGIIVNDAVKGTPLDGILQPLARMEEKGGKVGALVLPPILVGAISMKPELYPVLRPALKYAIISWMEVSEPAMKKAAQRAERFQEKFGVNTAQIDQMIEALFSPAPEQMPEPEAAGV